MTAPCEHPPRPATGVVVGITGHRHLPPDQLAAIEAALTTLLADIVAAAPGGARDVTMLSQLAAGADQLAARVAIAGGVPIGAVLPFDRDRFAATLTADDREAFEALYARAEGHRWTLPDEPEPADRAFLLAGDAMIGEADVIVAIWNGESANGLGGTADVVESAVRRGVPVIHVPLAAPDRPVVIWAGLSGFAPDLLRRQLAPRAPLTEPLLRRLVAEQVAPPASPTEAQALARFLAECDRRWRPRMEYPVLLAATGVRRITRASFRAIPRQAIAPEARFRLIDDAFCWADRLADHYGELYRGGAIFNYVAAALAVVASLFGLVTPYWLKPVLLASELGLVAALIVNTRLGWRGDWHQRWLDYRYLAEMLRPMASLKSASIAGRIGGPRGQPRSERWMDWYAGAVWRAVGVPPSLPDAEAVGMLRDHILATDLEPQIAYHRLNAHRMHLLDHRLHRFGTVLFALTILLGIASLVMWATHVDLPAALKPWTTVLGAGLPTIGAACFGIRGQLDLVGTAARSSQTAAALDPIARQLRDAGDDLLAVAQAIDAGAAVMLQDLADWRVSYRERKLAIPS